MPPNQKKRTRHDPDVKPDVASAFRVAIRSAILEDPELVEELRRRIAVAPRASYVSTADGERPAGFEGDGTAAGNARAKSRLLRIFREHRDELGVESVGKLRLVRADRWAAFVASGRTRRAEPPTPSDEDELNAALGIRRIG